MYPFWKLNIDFNIHAPIWTPNIDSDVNVPMWDIQQHVAYYDLSLT